MTPDERKILEADNENWVSIDVACKILGYDDKTYASRAIRKGYFKGKIGFRSFTGRYFTYFLPDLLKLKEQMTVPAKRV